MFEPWIGSQFSSVNNYLEGNKILILGESHYSLDSEWVGKTISCETTTVINDLALKNPYKFFRKITRLVTGEEIDGFSAESNSYFWHSVSFYNYIPVFLSKGGRPDYQTWVTGRKPLQSVLARIQPDGVIVCGKGLWWWVMDAQPGGIAANSAERDIAPIGSAIGVRIPHPTGARGASRYIYEQSRPLVERMFAQITD